MAATFVPDGDVLCAVAKELVAVPHLVDVEQSLTWNDPPVDGVVAVAFAADDVRGIGHVAAESNRRARPPQQLVC